MATSATELIGFISDLQQEEVQNTELMKGILVENHSWFEEDERLKKQQCDFSGGSTANPSEDHTENTVTASGERPAAAEW